MELKNSRNAWSWLVAIATTLAVAGFVRPALAQLSLGTPQTDPPRVELGIGAFDVTPDVTHPDSRTAAEFNGEYHFGDVLWIISPFLGASVTSDGGFYGYGGFGFDVNFTPNIVLTPHGALGYFARGSGTNLGFPLEFRSGAALAWRLPDESRIGLDITHTSNAGLGKSNPGEQSVLLTYSIPLHW